MVGNRPTSLRRGEGWVSSHVSGLLGANGGSEGEGGGGRLGGR